MNKTTYFSLSFILIFTLMTLAPPAFCAKPVAAKTTAISKTFSPVLNFHTMLQKGKTSLANEVSLGTQSKAKKQGKGTDLSSESREIKDVKPLKARSAKFFAINRVNYFKKPIQLKARKGLFRGTTHLNVKAMTLQPTAMLPLKVNPALLKIKRGATTPPRPDIEIKKVEWVGGAHGEAKALRSIAKSSNGKWLRFRVNLRNDGDAPAYRINVTAEHNGSEWPSEDFHIVKMMPKRGTKVFEVKILIPPTARDNRNHTINFYADKEGVNNDKNPKNNKVSMTFKLTPPIEPDLYLKQFKKVKVGSQKDWGPFKRGYIRYKYDVEVGNKGKKAAPPTKVSFLVQKVDHRKKKKEASLYRSWNYNIPGLNISKSHKFRTGDWKVYADQSCRVDCAVDPENVIVELNEGNNSAAQQFTVKVKNPFKGTFLAAAWRAGYKASIKIGDAIYDGAVWVYKKVRAASQYALAAVITPEMIAWVEISKQIHHPKGRHLNATEKNLLKPLFPQSLLNEARIVTVNSYERPEFWGDAIAVTFKNVIVFNKGKYSQRTLVHEMVHSYQYKRLGLAKFCWEYIYTWIKTGFSYRSISLEKQAYGYDANWANGKAEPIQDYLGY